MLSNKSSVAIDLICSLVWASAAQITNQIKAHKTRQQLTFFFEHSIKKLDS